MNATYKIAMAAGADEANRLMRAGGRTSWGDDDYDACCALIESLLGPEYILTAEDRA